MVLDRRDLDEEPRRDLLVRETFGDQLARSARSRAVSAARSAGARRVASDGSAAAASSRCAAGSSPRRAPRSRRWPRARRARLALDEADHAQLGERDHVLLVLRRAERDDGSGRAVHHVADRARQRGGPASNARVHDDDVDDARAPSAEGTLRHVQPLVRREHRSECLATHTNIADEQTRMDARLLQASSGRHSTSRSNVTDDNGLTEARLSRRSGFTYTPARSLSIVRRADWI